MIELRNNGPEADGCIEAGRDEPASQRLSAAAARHHAASLEVFDFAEQGMVTGSRDTTTVATQALYLLNDPFVRRQSLALAERLLARSGSDDAGRIDWAYRLALGRTATTGEIERALRYLADYEAAAAERPSLPAPMRTDELRP